MKKENIISFIIILFFFPFGVWFFLELVGVESNIRFTGRTMLYLCAGIIAVIIVGLIALYYWNVNYMEQQRVSGSDKSRLLHRMAKEMGERYADYTYVTAYVTQLSKRGRHINHPYTYYPRQPYIIAFNNSETVIYRFQVKQGVIQLFPREDIIWESVSWKYHIGEDHIELVIANSPSFLGVAEAMPILGTKYEIDKVLHRALHPLGIYQENEFWRFLKCLADYPNSQQY